MYVKKKKKSNTRMLRTSYTCTVRKLRMILQYVYAVAWYQLRSWAVPHCTTAYYHRNSGNMMNRYSKWFAKSLYIVCPYLYSASVVPSLPPASSVDHQVIGGAVPVSATLVRPGQPVHGTRYTRNKVPNKFTFIFTFSVGKSTKNIVEFIYSGKELTRQINEK